MQLMDVPVSSVSDLFLDRLQNVQNFSNVAILGLQKAGEPTSLVGESHVHHCLQSNLDLRIRMRSNGSRWDVNWRVLRQAGVESSSPGLLLVSDHSPVLLVIRRCSSLSRGRGVLLLLFVDDNLLLLLPLLLLLYLLLQLLLLLFFNLLLLF